MINESLSKLCEFWREESEFFSKSSHGWMLAFRRLARRYRKEHKVLMSIYDAQFCGGPEIEDLRAYIEKEMGW